MTENETPIETPEPTTSREVEPHFMQSLGSGRD